MSAYHANAERDSWAQTKLKIRSFHSQYWKCDRKTIAEHCYCAQYWSIFVFTISLFFGAMANSLLHNTSNVSPLFPHLISIHLCKQHLTNIHGFVHGHFWCDWVMHHSSSVARYVHRMTGSRPIRRTCCLWYCVCSALVCVVVAALVSAVAEELARRATEQNKRKTPKTHNFHANLTLNWKTSWAKIGGRVFFCYASSTKRADEPFSYTTSRSFFCHLMAEWVYVI